MQLEINYLILHRDFGKLFMSLKGENCFVTLLELLNVKYTKDFSNRYFNEHPHKHNLYGLSKMLSDYGIRNAATRIEDRENDLFNIECPFVAHSGGEFVVVSRITPALSKGEEESGEGTVHFFRNGEKISLPFSQFIQSWSGVILLTETSSDSIEPDYSPHRKKNLMNIAQQFIIVLAVLLILGFAYINNIVLGEHTGSPLRFIYSLLGITFLLITSFVGVYICYLLVLKQLRINSRYADKICTLFSKSDCNNVLESDATKLWGVFGWSEIGLGYFSANIVILLFLPHLIPYLILFNILALPYTVWSIWYQKVKAHQWCPLCLIVQVLLWAIFIINLTFGYIILEFFFHSPLSFVNCQLLISACIYVIPIFALNLIIPKLGEGSQVVQLRQEINSIKASEEVFKTLLLKQPYYEVSKTDSQILFGNPEAKLQITILTNPFCNPCAKMHTRVDKYITNKGESTSHKKEMNICIQYIFSAFNESLEYVNRYFIADYLEKGSEAAWQIYTEWFEKGKTLKEDFFKDLQLDMTNLAIEVEFQKHESWKEKTLLRATPTILVNGYKLPENYKIEDLRYFAEFYENVI